MTVYLYDERRWIYEDPDVYAEFLEGSVTDLIVLVWGYRYTGIVGYKSDLVASDSRYTELLGRVIAAMHRRGIRVHASFQVCRINKATLARFPSYKRFPFYKNASKFVDVHNNEFQTFISDLMSESAKLPIAGVCLDYIRTSDYHNAEKNDISIGNIVKETFEKIKFINPECIVSSTTKPYIDLTYGDYKRSGRKAIHWANAGYHDVIFYMSYGNDNVNGVYGDPPDMDVVYKARKLTDTPVIVMASSYKKDSAGKSVPTDSEQFAKVLDSVFDEDDIAIYTGWLFTDEQAILVEQF